MRDGYHGSRFAEDRRRDVLWRSLWQHYFVSRVSPEDCVLDLGSGYGSFINQVVARRRVAIDTWPGFVEYLAPGVEGVIGDAADLSFLKDESVDFAFASNLFEHLPRPVFTNVLETLRKKLSRSGSLTILQPNYRYAYKEYFDDYTHVSVYSHVSLGDFLAAQGWEVLDLRPRFLPLTIKSRLPVHPLLIRAYLASPIKPGAKQMLVHARPYR